MPFDSLAIHQTRTIVFCRKTYMLVGQGKCHGLDFMPAKKHKFSSYSRFTAKCIELCQLRQTYCNPENRCHGRERRLGKSMDPQVCPPGKKKASRASGWLTIFFSETMTVVYAETRARNVAITSSISSCFIGTYSGRIMLRSAAISEAGK